MFRIHNALITGALGLLVLWGCGDDPMSAAPEIPPIRSGDLGDFTQNPDAFPGFWVLTPLVPEDPVIDDSFNPDLGVSIRICLHGGDPTTSEVFGFDACETAPVDLFGPEDIQIDTQDEFYKVNYDTDADGPDLMTQRYYRLFWVVDGSLLGYRDIFVADPAPGTPPPTTVEAYGAKKGEVIPLKVFIGQSALCSPDAPACGAGTIVLSEGGEIVVTDDQGNVRGGLSVPAQPTLEGAVTFIMEELILEPGIKCLGPDFDAVEFGPCLDLSTASGATGLNGGEGLEVPATVVNCVALPADLPLSEAELKGAQLGKFHVNEDGSSLVLALPEAAETICDLGTTGQGEGTFLGRFVSRGLKFLGLAPTPLYAVDIGFGGSDPMTITSHYAFFLPGTGEAAESDLGIHREGTTVTATVLVLDGEAPAPDGAGAQPYPGVTVDWLVTGGGGTVSAATTTTDSGGAGSVGWTLGPPGAQELVASLTGITATLPPHDQQTLLEPLEIVFTAFTCQPGFGTPVLPLDGAVDDGEWGCANSATFTANVSGGSGVPATVFWMNDGTNLYLAVSFPRNESDKVHSVRFDFDNTLDGATAEDDVIGFQAGATVPFFDHFLGEKCSSKSQSGCSDADVSAGGTSDGAARFHNDGTKSMYELFHPLASGDTRDFAKQAGERLGFFLSLQIGNGAQGNTQWPGFRDYRMITIE